MANIIGQKDPTRLKSSFYYGDPKAGLATKKQVDFVGAGHTHGRIVAKDIFEAFELGARPGTSFVIGGVQPLGSEPLFEAQMSHFSRVFSMMDLELVKKSKDLKFYEDALVSGKGAILDMDVRLKEIAVENKALLNDIDALKEEIVKAREQREVREAELLEAREDCAKGRKTDPAGDVDGCKKLAADGDTLEREIAELTRKIDDLFPVLKAKQARQTELELLEGELFEGRDAMISNLMVYEKRATQANEELSAAKELYAKVGGDECCAIPEMNAIAVGLKSLEVGPGEAIFCDNLDEEATSNVDQLLAIFGGAKS